MNQAAAGWSPLLALQRAAHATVYELAAELAHLGLTASELNALANLADGGSRSASDLGRAAGTRPTTLTSVLDRLERRRYITRRRSPGDRRAVVIELTSSGRQAAAATRHAITGIEQRALGSLPASTIAGLRTALEAFTEAAA